MVVPGWDSAVPAAGQYARIGLRAPYEISGTDKEYACTRLVGAGSFRVHLYQGIGNVQAAWYECDGSGMALLYPEGRSVQTYSYFTGPLSTHLGVSFSVYRSRLYSSDNFERFAPGQQIAGTWQQDALREVRNQSLKTEFLQIIVRGTRTIVLDFDVYCGGTQRAGTASAQSGTDMAGGGAGEREGSGNACTGGGGRAGRKGARYWSGVCHRVYAIRGGQKRASWHTTRDADLAWG
eukprot:222702-Rhodomonas_salina.3